MRLNNVLRYEGFILVGVLMAVGVLIKRFGLVNFSSDWFWLIAGIGLIIEGTISWKKQKEFDKKYKVVTKDEYEIMINGKNGEVAHLVH